MKTYYTNSICRVLAICIALLFQISASHCAFAKESANFGRAVISQTQVNPEEGRFNVKDSLGIYLKEITVSASFINDRSSPIRIKTVSNKDIEKKAIGITYPELLKDIPGIYATSESGSYGDAKINIRGFKQENISVLLNGIPISGLVTGNMFWNNWMGLADATYSIQVQKGIGASMLSDNSVGGTINIITNTTNPDPSFAAGLYFTDYGQKKSFLNYNSGKSKNGWAMSLMASYAWGNGYVECSDINSWAYMLNVSKKINNRNSLLLTLLGSPERHEQRSVRLTNSEVEKYGLKYSKNWGYLNGKAKNLSENFYHKPYITLNHFYTPKENLSLNNTLYLSVGDGGGKWSESKGKRIIDFQKDGHIDWDAVIAANESIPYNADYSKEGSAKNIISDYLAGHTQAGFKSNLDYKTPAGFDFQGGIHYQYYATWEKEKITDLLGGNYWYEDYADKSLAATAGRNPVKRVGDFIRTYNGKIINHATTYITGNYKNDKWDIRLGASYMWNNYKRWDKYNYVNSPSSKATGINSPGVSASGYSLKGGALYRISINHSIYLNAASYSRLPYSDVFFSNGTNVVTSNVRNEKNILAELGYRYIHDKGTVELTGYYAYWKNKTVMSDPYKQQDNSTYLYMIKGLDAIHYGMELNANQKISRWIDLSACMSLGNWKWKNDVSANIYDPYSGMITDEINVYSNGLHVGDAPQTQFSLMADISLAKGIQLSADWKYNSRLYADFDPTKRTEASDRAESFRLPDYHLVDLGFNWKKDWDVEVCENRKLSSTIFLNVNNLLNEKYIERGKDGSDHTLSSFTGYWAAGITGSIGVRLEF